MQSIYNLKTNIHLQVGDHKLLSRDDACLITILPGIRKAVRHARMAHKATKWPIKKILTGPVMRPDRTKLVK